MTVPDGRARVLADLLARMQGAWPAGRWEWDARLACALSTVAQANEAQARAALATALPTTFTAATLGSAPASVREVCGMTGGLRGSQMIFTAEHEGELVTFCLWWPWGDGAQVSARVGTIDEALDPTLRSALGLPEPQKKA